MNHLTHDNHTHMHNERCGHTAIQHNDHVDYLHDGHLHASHEGHYVEHVIEVGAQNPADCAPTQCDCGHQTCGHEKVPHGDHVDFLINGRLHHPHNGHCDDHGPVSLA